VALRLEAEIISIQTKYPFKIARHEHNEVRTVLVKLKDDDGVEGWGEATPQRFYGETPETVLAALQTYATILPKDPFQLETTERQWEALLVNNNSARAALSTALHDLVGKRLGVPVHRMWGLDPAAAPRSTFTIGIDSAEMIKKKVREAEQYPILKIKLGSDQDMITLKAIREVTDRELRVDANCGWTVKQTIRMLPVLEEYGVTVLEQPLVREDIDGLALIRRKSRIPLIVDESCITSADIPRPRGQGRRHQHQAGQDRQPHRGDPDDPHRPRPSDDGHGGLHGGDLDRDHRRRRSSRRWSTSSTSTARRCWRRTHTSGATIHGGQLTIPTGPGLGRFETQLTIWRSGNLAIEVLEFPIARSPDRWIAR
jgi:hypothetical protein